VDGKHVNLESAIEQLERYKMLMKNYVDHNASVTISYDKDEVEDIIDWLQANWDNYVGVSFLYRNDPTKTAKDLGYPYLPQEVVTKEVYEQYMATLKPLDFGDKVSNSDLEEDCAGGVCPIR
jgi:ribonucleoside-triphosphate reductase